MHTPIRLVAGLGNPGRDYAGTRHKMSLEQWTVGSRGFGPLLMWLLMRAESRDEAAEAAQPTAGGNAGPPQ